MVPPSSSGSVSSGAGTPAESGTEVASQKLGLDLGRRGMAATAEVRITVNGKGYEDAVEPRLLLVHYLRDKLGLTGTHVGCDTTNCGACTVHLNGEAVKSCTVLAVQADGAQGETVEGMGAAEGGPPPPPEAFREQ